LACTVRFNFFVWEEVQLGLINERVGTFEFGPTYFNQNLPPTYKMFPFFSFFFGSRAIVILSTEWCKISPFFFFFFGMVIVNLIFFLKKYIYIYFCKYFIKKDFCLDQKRKRKMYFLFKVNLCSKFNLGINERSKFLP
jgi:hypothetical protein